MNERKGDYMQCFTGGLYWPLDPRPEDVSIFDIAHSLSMQCRYTGHCAQFYSVAEHSVHVSYLVPPEFALVGLLHDATEAYLTDVARPVKRHLTNYAELEALNWRVIAEHFQVPVALPAEVHEADADILQAERIALMRPRPEAWPGDAARSADVDIQCWSPHMAETRFLTRFLELAHARAYWNWDRRCAELRTITEE